MRVFLDTNILLDVIIDRKDQHLKENANIILQFGKDRVIDLYMSVLSIPTIAYVLKNVSGSSKKSIIRSLCLIVHPLPSLPEHIDMMLENPMDNIEDALQVCSAKSGNCDLIITRDRSDFKNSDIPSLSPDEFLERVLE